MRINAIRKIGRVAIAALLLAGSAGFAASPAKHPCEVAADARTWNFQEEASDLLADVKLASAQLDRDADRLATLTRSGVSWQSHAQQLSLVREHINNIGDRLERLQEIRHVTAPWQQQAIDRIVPVAVELASRTEAAIGHLSENRSHLFAPAYTDHLSAISEHAGNLRESVNAFLELADTQQKIEHLQERISGLQS